MIHPGSPGRRDESRRVAHRVRPLALALAALLLAGVVTRVFGAVAASSFAQVSGPGPSSPADLLVVGMAAAGALLSAWLGLGFAVAALSALPGTIGAAFEDAAGRVAPAAVRRIVALLLGTALSATLVPGTASAEGALAPGGHPAISASVQAPDPGSRPTTSSGPIAPDPAFRPTTEHPGDAVGPGPGPTTDPPTASSSTAPAALGAPAAHQALPAASPSGAPAPDPAFHPTIPTGTDGADRPAYTPVAPSAPATAQSLAPLSHAPRAGTSVEAEIVVRRGDTLWDIAARHLGPDATTAEIAHEWPRWHEANRGVVGDDPDRIQPGQRLTPPTNGATS